MSAMSDPQQIDVRRKSARVNQPGTAARDTAKGKAVFSVKRDMRLVHATQVFRARRPNPFLFGDGATRYHMLKRSFDVGMCLAVLPLAVPVFTLCALAVRVTSRGPVLFVQQRAGRGGRPFSILKIRTMVVDAEARKAALRKLDTNDGPDFKLTDDPRVTRVGSFLRKTSLDEIPQLWNVLKGDMSLVGPRPTSFGVETYEHWHTERLEVQPGVTGLWQIKLRGDTNFCERVRLDIAYVRARSFSLDLQILLQTLPSVLFGRGAF